MTWVRCSPVRTVFVWISAQEQMYPSFSEQPHVGAGSVFWSNQFAKASAWLYHVLTHPTNLCVSQTTCDLPFHRLWSLLPRVCPVCWGARGTQEGSPTPCRVPSAWALCHPGAALWGEATVTKQGSWRGDISLDAVSPCLFCCPVCSCPFPA